MAPPGARTARPGAHGTRPTARTARDVAVAALVRVDDGAFSNLVLPGLLAASGLEARERAFATELTYGTLRWQRRLDHLLAPLVDRPVPRLDPAVRAALRLGAYQLAVVGVPAHAAVASTVDAVAGPLPRARGFVNAVLRRLATLGPPFVVDGAGSDGGEPLGVELSHPDWIVERAVAAFGPDGGRAVLELDNVPAPVTLRFNPARATVDQVVVDLVTTGAEVARGTLVPDALVVRHGGDPGALDVVRRGLATPQDQGSQAVAALVGAVSGDVVLDLAAAPGGKATAIAERTGDVGIVVALDVRPGRVARVAQAVQRLGLMSVHPVVGDGRTPPVRPASVDRVLVDAPCSGLGVLRRRPEARWRLTPDAPERLVPLQRELLAAAAAAVRPGGVVVYAVCTFAIEETTGIDAWARDALPGLVALDPPGSPWTPSGRGALLAPSAEGTDGMWALVLRRAR